MKTEKALLQFGGYRVDKMLFMLKQTFDSSSKQVELTPSFSRTIQKISDDEYDVSIGVELKQTNLPFDAELTITGRFKYEGSLDVQKILKINAVAILYPYVRSILSCLTTLGSVPPVVIPTINLAQMFENEEQGEIETSDK